VFLIRTRTNSVSASGSSASMDGSVFETGLLALFGVRVRTIGASLAHLGRMMTV
jgi:hypothetical protein